MCFYTREKAKVAKVARFDIIAFKLMNDVTYSEAHSPFRTKRWKVGVVEKSNLKVKLDYEGQNINEGLHCFKSRRDAMSYSSRERRNKLVAVLIPKGSNYYDNDTQIVSDTMILLGDVKMFKNVVKKLA